MSRSFDRLVEIMDRLRAPGGCPWDQEQTLESLTAYLLEEAYEAVEAVRSGTPEGLCEELGDLILQIVFMARIARERGWFDVDRVCDGISDKLVRRHPHVFSDREVSGPDEVVRNWEDIKRGEREDTGQRSALDGVPAALPALLKAYRVTEKAAALGFDWGKPSDVVDTLDEELAELADEVRAPNPDMARVREEFGDLLFVMANLARHLGIEPETALQEANGKFIRRFRSVEDRVRAEGGEMRSRTLAELDRLWERVKGDE